MEKETFIKKNKEFFEKWAQFYDIIEIAVKGVRKYIVNLILNSSNLEILDVCTGTGSLALKFATMKKHKIIGIDLSEEMLTQARDKNKFSKVRFIKGDATELPFNNSSKDICTISFSFHDMPHEIRLEVFKEMFRVTKPTGYIIIADYNRPQNKLLQQFYFQFTKFYESEFYASWYWNNYFKDFLRMKPVNVLLNKTFRCAFIRVLVIKPKKNAKLYYVSPSYEN